MSIYVIDPTGEVARTQLNKEEFKLDMLEGKKIGYIFNQHRSAVDFWKALEQAVYIKFSPKSVHRVYKENTWAPAPKAEVDKLVAETDFALVGLGA